MRKPILDCCLCGLPYERVGNNPAPLVDKVGARCCDACNEVVTEARIDPAGFRNELERVEAAMLRKVKGGPRAAALAAICAARGPDLWAAHKAELEKLREHWPRLNAEL